MNAAGDLHRGAQVSRSGNPTHGRRVRGGELALLAASHKSIEELEIRRRQVGGTIAPIGDETYAPKVVGLQGKLLCRGVRPQLLRVGIRKETIAYGIGDSSRHRL